MSMVSQQTITEIKNANFTEIGRKIHNLINNCSTLTDAAWGIREAGSES